MRCGPAELSTRADGRQLAARNPGASELTFEGLLSAEARAAAWRIVEAFSDDGLPFELELGWSSGSGVGAKALVTIARSARICVFARSLRVRSANLVDATNRVGITVADGWTVTENTQEATGISGDLPTDVPIPPFAKRVRIELEDPSRVPLALVHLYNGLDQLRSTFSVADQPPEGVLVGGARRMTVTVGNNTGWRAVFSLSL